MKYSQEKVFGKLNIYTLHNIYEKITTLYKRITFAHCSLQLNIIDKPTMSCFIEICKELKTHVNKVKRKQKHHEGMFILVQFIDRRH